MCVTDIGRHNSTLATSADESLAAEGADRLKVPHLLEHCYERTVAVKLQGVQVVPHTGLHQPCVRGGAVHEKVVPHA